MFDEAFKDRANIWEIDMTEPSRLAKFLLAAVFAAVFTAAYLAVLA